MAILLGVDTGGTYTDAVLLDEDTNTVLAAAKSLTTRPDLALGIGRAIDAVLDESSVDGGQIAMVSLSTTLATNALVEGQGGRIALVFIGFDAAELNRAGLTDALAGDPVIMLAGGHNHAGGEAAPLDLSALESRLADLPEGLTGIAVAASFATRNPAHEIAARDLIRRVTGKPVTCSHELSSALGGPKRALTAVLNARLIGMLDRLIGACEGHLAKVGIHARLMVVRGDGALVSAELARERPIETILSGPAASIAGASWLTGETDALVSDIGGTTTDICLLRNGKPKIDPQGARVGPYRTMVEAVAMRTWGLGGDSEVHIQDGLVGGLQLGPLRLMPVSLLAQDHPKLVHDALDRALTTDSPPHEAGRFVVPHWDTAPEGLDKREAAVLSRLANGPVRLQDAVETRVEAPALERLVKRGAVMIAGVTPSDAAHVLGQLEAWDSIAAQKALALFARRRTGNGDTIAKSAAVIAQLIIDQLTQQTAHCLLEAAFDEDDWDWGSHSAHSLGRHPLLQAGLAGHQGVLRFNAGLNVPVIGLGASAQNYYGAVGEMLHTPTILPAHGGVANAIGAVVGQVAMHESGSVTGAGSGVFVAHLPDGPKRFGNAEDAIEALTQALEIIATSKARAAGVEEIRLTQDRTIKAAEIEGQSMFVEATIKVTAQGRPRIAGD